MQFVVKIVKYDYVVLNRPVNYIFSFITRQQHQHGCQLVLKKKELLKKKVNITTGLVILTVK